MPHLIYNPQSRFHVFVGSLPLVGSPSLTDFSRKRVEVPSEANRSQGSLVTINPDLFRPPLPSWKSGVAIVPTLSECLHSLRGIAVVYFMAKNGENLSEDGPPISYTHEGVSVVEKNPTDQV